MTAINTILVFCPNWVGDVVMATPAFTHLRNHYQNARIIAVGRKNIIPVIADSPWFDACISGQDKTLKGFIALTKELRALKPDLAIVLPNSQRAAMLARFSGAKTVVGYQRKGRGLLLTQGPKPEMQDGKVIYVPMQIYYLKLCENLGITVDYNMKNSLYYSAELKQKAEQILAKHGIKPEDKVIGLIPGASYGPSKRWSPVSFGRLATLLEQKYGCRIIMFAAPSEADIAEAVLQHTEAKIVSMLDEKVGLDLMKPLIARCNVLITNDTGPRHYGVALDVPQVVVILGSTTRNISNDLGNTTVVCLDLPCAPCQQKICPLEHHRCMNEITPEMVLEAVRL